MKSRRTCAALVLALALAGCSDDGAEPDGDDPSSPTSSSAPTATDASSAEPSVQPATGKEMTSDQVTLRLPAEADWIITRGGRSGHHPGDDGTLSSVFIGSGGEGFDSLEEVSRTSLSVLRDSRPSARLGDNRTVAGVEGITLSAEDDRGYYYEFGTTRAGVEVSISFAFPVRDAASEAWIESILASVVWK